MTDLPVLSPRALNRATLARQMLLARQTHDAVTAVERLFALQAQLARPPFVALWSRLEGFRRDDLAAGLHRRELVRATMMRCTLHLASARDYGRFRKGLQPVLTRAMRGALRGRTDGLDLDAVVAVAQVYLAEAPRTFDSVRKHLETRFPGIDPRVMGHAVRTHLPLVQVPTSATWAYPASAEFALADTWLDGGYAPDDGLTDMVLRYLAALGPATVADAQVWSGHQGLRPVFDALRPRLTVFHDGRGKEVFDLPEAPRPGEEVPAPVRFLPEFDNVAMGHDDRSRVIDDADRPRIFLANLRVLPVFLVDGRVAGTWSIARKTSLATVTVAPFRRLPAGVRREVADEAGRLVRFTEADANRFDVQFASA